MNTRQKGVRFEREVAKAFEAAGFAVRGLESGGDHLCVYHLDGSTYTLAVEAKRQERLRIPEWIEQMERDAPAGVDRVLVFRQSGDRAYAVVPLDQYLRRVT